MLAKQVFTQFSNHCFSKTFCKIQRHKYDKPQVTTPLPTFPEQPPQIGHLNPIDSADFLSRVAHLFCSLFVSAWSLLQGKLPSYVFLLYGMHYSLRNAQQVPFRRGQFPKKFPPFNSLNDQRCVSVLFRTWHNR